MSFNKFLARSESVSGRIQCTMRQSAPAEWPHSIHCCGWNEFAKKFVRAQLQPRLEHVHERRSSRTQKRKKQVALGHKRRGFLLLRGQGV
jgi:hypothetical protein